MCGGKCSGDSAQVGLPASRVLPRQSHRRAHHARECREEDGVAPRGGKTEPLRCKGTRSGALQSKAE